MLKRFAGEKSGGIAVMFAVSAPALLCVAGVAVDYSKMALMKAELQSVADAAALAGARQLALTNVSTSQVGSVVAQTIDFHAMNGGIPITHQVQADIKQREVVVDAEQSWSPFFAHFIDVSVTPVRARAKARLLHGSTRICVMALNPSGAKAVHLDKTSTITALDCGVYVNSKHSSGLQVDKEGKIRARLNCAAGGAKAAKATSILAEPITDCPAIEDPLKDRLPPDTAGCDFQDVKVTSGNKTLVPGIYCGGLEVSGTAKATLNSGIYVIKDGPFRVQNSAAVQGDDVGFYLTGSPALIDFSGDSSIQISGPESGSMAGLLFFEDRAAKLGRKHRINATGADRLVGTIYLPRGQLLIDPNSSVAEDSAYTAIIAYEISLNEGPNLVLNADYDATDVPVPEGIKTSSTVVLSE
jgi:Flp pilus assembly protein TadG